MLKFIVFDSTRLINGRRDVHLFSKSRDGLIKAWEFAGNHEARPKSQINYGLIGAHSWDEMFSSIEEIEAFYNRYHGPWGFYIIYDNPEEFRPYPTNLPPVDHA